MAKYTVLSWLEFIALAVAIAANDGRWFQSWNDYK
jgi:hypothetical protein